MRVLEPWMGKDAIVYAHNKPGKIVSMQTGTVRGIDYVYKVEVLMDGMRYSGEYNPNDIKQFKQHPVTSYKSKYA